MSTLPALAFLILSLPGNRAPAPGGPQPTDAPRDVAGTQTATPASTTDTATPKRAKPLTATPTAASLRQRFQPLGLTSGLLFHNQHDAQGATTMSQLRGQLQASGRLQVDPVGRIAVGAGVATGASFRSGWNHTAVGSFPADTALHVKQLYLAARPSAHVDVQAGSFGAARGHGSEMTGFDNDGYLVGERLTLRVRRLWFDDVVVTRAYVGDLRTASAFDRMRRLSTANYLQVVGGRRLALANVSVEVSDWDDLRTVGGAVQTTHVRGLSQLRLEGSTIAGSRRGSALAALAERAAGPLTFGIGASHVAAPLGLLNGDRYGAGGRVFAQTLWRPRPELSISLFGSRAVGTGGQEPRTRLDVLVNCDILRALARGR